MSDHCPVYGPRHAGPMERDEAAMGWRALCDGCGARSGMFVTDEQVLGAGLVLDSGSVYWMAT